MGTRAGRVGRAMGTKFVDKIKVDVSTAVSAYQGLGITASVFSFFQGRATAFAIFFSAEGAIIIGVGIWGFLHGKDLTSLAALLQAIAIFDAAIFTGVVGHSIKEDYFARRSQTTITGTDASQTTSTHGTDVTQGQ